MSDEQPPAPGDASSGGSDVGPTAQTTLDAPTLAAFMELIRSVKLLGFSLAKISDRLDSWDQIYETRDGRKLHSIRETATVFPKG